MQIIGPIDIIAAGIPRVEIDAAEVHNPQQRRQVLDDGKADHVARAVLDRADLDPVGPRRRRPLHEEELAIDAAGIALHHHRAILQMRQQHRRDCGIVPQQITLGNLLAGPEDFLKIGQSDGAAADFQLDVVGVFRNRHARRVRTTGLRSLQATLPRWMIIARSNLLGRSTAHGLPQWSDSSIEQLPCRRRT